ncbi:MAG: RNA polymerase sigma factor [Planctomycetes bacterium]|nr:RNA polymerase sigma factor [Planctomycetota bacterium]
MHQSDVERLFKEHARAVHAAVYSVTLDRDAAEDAVQEAFVRLLRTPPGDQSNLPAWLKRVAVNHAIDVLRRKGRIKPLGETEPEQPPQADPITDINPKLTAALQRISPDQRAAVLAVDRDGMAYADAAALLGSQLSKLKSDLCRGRRALLELLKGAVEPGLPTPARQS